MDDEGFDIAIACYLDAQRTSAIITAHLEAEYGSVDAFLEAFDAQFVNQKGRTPEEMMALLTSDDET